MKSCSAHNLDLYIVQRVVEGVIGRGDEFADTPTGQGSALRTMKGCIAEDFASLDQLQRLLVGRKARRSRWPYNEVEH